MSTASQIRMKAATSVATTAIALSPMYAIDPQLDPAFVAVSGGGSIGSTVGPPLPAAKNGAAASHMYADEYAASLEKFNAIRAFIDKWSSSQQPEQVADASLTTDGYIDAGDDLPPLNASRWHPIEATVIREPRVRGSYNDDDAETWA